MDNLARLGISAFLWTIMGKLSNQIVTFILSIFLARLLSPADYGLLAMVSVFIGLSMIFSDLGLSSSVIQRKKLHFSHLSSVFYFNMAIATLLTILLFCAAPLISWFYDKPELYNLTKGMSLIFVVKAFSSVQNNLLIRSLNFKKLSKINFTSSIISGIVGVYFAFKGYGVWSLVIQQYILAGCFSILVWVFSDWKPQLCFSTKALKQLWGFGFNMFLSGFINNIYERLDILIIGKISPVATLGYYQRAKSLESMVISYSSGTLASILFPLLSKIQNDLARYQSVIKKLFQILVFVTFMLLGNLYLSSYELILLLFTKKWLPCLEYYQIMIFAGFVVPLSSLLCDVLSSRGNSKEFLRLEIYKKIICSLAFIALFYFGLKGFLFASLFTGFTALLLNIGFVIKELRMKWSVFLHPLLIALFITPLLVFGVNHFIHFHSIWLALIFKTIAFSILYIFASKYIFIDLYANLLNIFKNKTI